MTSTYKKINRLMFLLVLMINQYFSMNDYQSSDQHTNNQAHNMEPILNLGNTHTPGNTGTPGYTPGKDSAADPATANITANITTGTNMFIDNVHDNIIINKLDIDKKQIDKELDKNLKNDNPDAWAEVDSNADSEFEIGLNTINFNGSSKIQNSSQSHPNGPVIKTQSNLNSGKGSNHNGQGIKNQSKPNNGTGSNSNGQGLNNQSQGNTWKSDNQKPQSNGNGQGINTQIQHNNGKGGHNQSKPNNQKFQDPRNGQGINTQNKPNNWKSHNQNPLYQENSSYKNNAIDYDKNFSDQSIRMLLPNQTDIKIDKKHQYSRQIIQFMIQIEYFTPNFTINELMTDLLYLQEHQNICYQIFNKIKNDNNFSFAQFLKNNYNAFALRNEIIIQITNLFKNIQDHNENLFLSEKANESNGSQSNEDESYSAKYSTNQNNLNFFKMNGSELLSTILNYGKFNQIMQIINVDKTLSKSKSTTLNRNLSIFCYETTFMDIIKKLVTQYVYLLCDPINGKNFYRRNEISLYRNDINSLIQALGQPLSNKSNGDKVLIKVEFFNIIIDALNKIYFDSDMDEADKTNSYIDLILNYYNHEDKEILHNIFIIIQSIYNNSLIDNINEGNNDDGFETITAYTRRSVITKFSRKSNYKSMPNKNYQRKQSNSDSNDARSEYNPGDMNQLNKELELKNSNALELKNINPLDSKNKKKSQLNNNYILDIDNKISNNTLIVDKNLSYDSGSFGGNKKKNKKSTSQETASFCRNNEESKHDQESTTHSKKPPQTNPKQLKPQEGYNPLYENDSNDEDQYQNRHHGNRNDNNSMIMNKNNDNIHNDNIHPNYNISPNYSPNFHYPSHEDNIIMGNGRNQSQFNHSNKFQRNKTPGRINNYNSGNPYDRRNQNNYPTYDNSFYAQNNNPYNPHYNKFHSQSNHNPYNPHYNKFHSQSNHNPHNPNLYGSHSQNPNLYGPHSQNPNLYGFNGQNFPYSQNHNSHNNNPQNFQFQNSYPQNSDFYDHRNNKFHYQSNPNAQNSYSQNPNYEQYQNNRDNRKNNNMNINYNKSYPTMEEGYEGKIEQSDEIANNNNYQKKYDELPVTRDPNKFVNRNNERQLPGPQPLAPTKSEVRKILEKEGIFKQ